MMRRIAAGAACCLGVASGAWAADVGVSIQFSQPGVYGRVDIGQYPQPQVIVSSPVLIAPPPPAGPPPEPIYLWVPPEHRKHWERYCAQYHACGHPVYFVNHNWYKDHVMAHRDEHREAHDRDHGREEEHGHHEGHDEGDHEHGHGHD